MFSSHIFQRFTAAAWCLSAFVHFTFDLSMRQASKMRRTVKISVQKKVLVVLGFQHDIHSLCRAWLDKSGTTVSPMFFFCIYFFKTAIAGLKDKTTKWRPKATFYKYSQILNMPNHYPFKSHLLHRTLQGKYSGRFYYRFSVLCPLISGRFRSLIWKQRLMLTMTFLNKITLLSHSLLYFHINTGSKRQLKTELLYIVLS